MKTSILVCMYIRISQNAKNNTKTSTEEEDERQSQHITGGRPQLHLQHLQQLLQRLQHSQRHQSILQFICWVQFCLQQLVTKCLGNSFNCSLICSLCNIRGIYVDINWQNSWENLLQLLSPYIIRPSLQPATLQMKTFGILRMDWMFLRQLFYHKQRYISNCHRMLSKKSFIAWF